MCSDFCFCSASWYSRGIASFAVGLKICEITAEIKKYKSIKKKNRKKHDKIVLSAKTKLNNIKVLIYKDLIDSYVFREHNDIKEEVKNPKSINIDNETKIKKNINWIYIVLNAYSL